MSNLRRVTCRAAGVALATALCAVGVQAQSPAQDHSGQYAASDIAVGQGVYGRLCSACHGPTGNAIGNVDLRRGPLPRASTDAALRALITNGLTQSGMPAFRLDPAELTGLVAFIRSGLEAPAASAPAVGDASRGRLVFEGKGNCLSCHRVADQGQFMGPDLTEIGRLRTPVAIQRSLVNPSASMQPINRPVRAVRSDGTVVTGRRLNEDLFTVQLITNDGRLVSLVKPELKEWTVSTTSTMPSYTSTLTAAEMADLVGYLVSLKGTRP